MLFLFQNNFTAIRYREYEVKICFPQMPFLTHNHCNMGVIFSILFSLYFQTKNLYVSLLSI